MLVWILSFIIVVCFKMRCVIASGCYQSHLVVCQNIVIVAVHVVAGITRSVIGIAKVSIDRDVIASLRPVGIRVYL